MFKLPAMNYRVDECVPESSVQSADKWRPLAWCSNLFQVVVVARGIAKLDDVDEPVKVRAFRLGSDGKEIAEVNIQTVCKAA